MKSDPRKEPEFLGNDGFSISGSQVDSRRVINRSAPVGADL